MELLVFADGIQILAEVSRETGLEVSLAMVTYWETGAGDRDGNFFDECNALALSRKLVNILR